MFGSFFDRLGVRFRPPRRAQDGPKRPPRSPRRPQEAAKTAQEAAKTAPRGSRKTERPPHFSVLAAKSLQGPPGTPPRLIFDQFFHIFKSIFGTSLVSFLESITHPSTHTHTTTTFSSLSSLLRGGIIQCRGRGDYPMQG